MSWQSDSSFVQCRWFPAASAVAADTTTSQDWSTSHSDTGDVLIRSTRLGTGRATEPVTVYITVERVRGDPVTKRLQLPKTPQALDNGWPLFAVSLRSSQLLPNGSAQLTCVCVFRQAGAPD